MKPRVQLAETRTPDGGKIVLCHEDGEFSILINGEELMGSLRFESELELARLGCAHLADRKTPCVLIGGLGMGYTLRRALDMVGPGAEMVVSELLPDVVRWNRDFLEHLNGQSLKDKRVRIEPGDVCGLIARSTDTFDAILLDVDNGPGAMTDSGNCHLYSLEGILACRRALRGQGCLAVWSAEESDPYEQRLMRCGFHVCRYWVSAYEGSQSQWYVVWVASENKAALPPGGEPCNSPPRPHR